MPSTQRILEALLLTGLGMWAMFAFVLGDLTVKSALIGCGSLTFGLGICLYCMIPKGTTGSRFVTTALDLVGVMQIFVAMNLPA